LRRLNSKMKNLEIPVRKLQVIPQVLYTRAAHALHLDQKILQSVICRT
jgi:hypothetical protein